MLDNDDKKQEPASSFISSSNSPSHRYRILTLIEAFIDQIFHIRKTLLGVSISAVIMAPIAIGLSVYLLRHPSFAAILDMENDFWDCTWRAARSYYHYLFGMACSWQKKAIQIVSSWNKRYGDYITLEIWQRLRLNMTSSRNIKLELEYAD